MEKALLTAVIVIVLVLPLYMVTNVTRAGAQAVQGSSIEDVTITNKKDGKTMWFIHTDRTSLAPDMSSALLEGVTVSLESKDVQVKAKNGEYDLGTMDLELSGGVEARSRDMVVKCDAVSLKSKTGEITSQGEIVVTSKRFAMTGTGLAMIGDKVKVEKNVRAEIK